MARGHGDSPKRTPLDPRRRTNYLSNKWTPRQRHCAVMVRLRLIHRHGAGLTTPNARFKFRQPHSPVAHPRSRSTPHRLLRWKTSPTTQTSGYAAHRCPAKTPWAHRLQTPEDCGDMMQQDPKATIVEVHARPWKDVSAQTEAQVQDLAPLFGWRSQEECRAVAQTQSTRTRTHDKNGLSRRLCPKSPTQADQHATAVNRRIPPTERHHTWPQTAMVSGPKSRQHEPMSTGWPTLGPCIERRCYRPLMSGGANSWPTSP